MVRTNYLRPLLLPSLRPLVDPPDRFFRESDEPRSGSRPGSRVSFQAAEAYSTRCLNKSNFPRPYIERLMNLSLFTRPSVCP
jgi:hypothetical protein